MATETAAILGRLDAMADGLIAEPPVGQATIVVAEKLEPVSDFANELRGYASLYRAVLVAEDALRVAIAARNAGAPDAVGRLVAGKEALQGALGRKNPKLRRYGVTPDKERTPLTTEQQAAANAKSKATREARHTLGKKQKLAITGKVPPATPPATTP